MRINGASTPWAYKDVIAVVEGAPGTVDSLVLPKVTSPSAVSWLDVLLGQAEQVAGLPPGCRPPAGPEPAACSYTTPHDRSVSSRPSVSGSVSSSAGPAHTASSASSPGTSAPPVTAAA